MAASPVAASSVADFPLACHSRLYQRVQRRYAREWAQLPAAPANDIGRTYMEQVLAALQAQGLDLSARLRVLRQWVVQRLMVLDCDGQAPLHVVTRAMTDLAELALDAACTHVCAALDARHGAPQSPHGAHTPVQLWVIGMGKLGARELNVSSDIDLIYVYEHDGQTAGLAGASISHHEYFSRAVQGISRLIGDITEHGQVFRVDLALRPHGKSGPAVLSLPALAQYLQTQGREWERFAWIKSRVVAPRAAVASARVQALRAVVLPFIFRRYLDYAVFDALRSLHRQIRQQATRRSAGQPGRADDVKLSRGGIREIEFTVQLLQVVRGGQYPELRCRPTLQALQRLQRAELMPAHTAQALGQAYTFLRRTEHRIQYLDDQQSHALPTRDDDLHWIARSMGYDSACPFLRQLDEHRERVAEAFDTLLGLDNGTANTSCPRCTCGPHCAAPATARAGISAQAPGTLPASIDDLLPQLPAPLAAHVAAWRSSSDDAPAALRASTRERLFRLLLRTGQWLVQGRISMAAAQRFADWLHPLLRRESYLALLCERAAAHERLLHLLGAARWSMHYLRQHPGSVDELASDTLLQERFKPAEFEDELELRRAALQSTGEDDDEALLNLLRRAHHGEVLRTLARDVERRISVEQVADDLSALADSILRVTLAWCWQRLPQKHRATPHLAIIGYGKLGGKELGYGSDLDIVFVFDDDDERAPEIYGALARKLIAWLTTKTAEGDLFDIDTALRPNGNSGQPVSRFAAWADYQHQRGSNTAWTWEHQAMTRARCITGSAALQARFDAVRQAVITAPRDRAALRAQIQSMRARIRQARPVPDALFDVKHSPGAMVDAEFAVQYLVLAHSAQYPQLRGNLGNITLLQRAEACALLPPGTGQNAAQAYRELRRLQHMARLNEHPTQIPAPQAAPLRRAVLDVWEAVFGV